MKQIVNNSDRNIDNSNGWWMVEILVDIGQKYLSDKLPRVQNHACNFDLEFKASCQTK